MKSKPKKQHTKEQELRIALSIYKSELRASNRQHNQILKACGLPDAAHLTWGGSGIQSVKAVIQIIRGLKKATPITFVRHKQAALEEHGGYDKR